MSSEHVEVLRRKLENIISGHRINEDDADWLRGLTHKAAIASLSAQQPPAEAQPVAWMRRCAFDRVDVLTLAKSDRPRGWNMHAVTENKALPDDVPLYAHPPPSAPVGVEAVLRDALQGLIDFIEIDNLPMDADAMFIAKRALAAQPGGSDNDR